MKKRIFITALILLTVLLGTFARGAEEISEEQVDLKLAIWSEPARAWIQEVIDEYEARNPNVTIELTVTPWGNYWSQLQTSLGGGGGPDLFWMNGPNFYRYASMGLLKDITPFIGKDGLDMDTYEKLLVRMYSYEGRNLAIPSYLDPTVGLFYNKELFDKAGLAYPDSSWTWEDVERAGAKLTDPNKGIYGFIADVMSSQNGYYPIIHQAGGFIISDDKTKSGFDDPRTIEGLKWMKKLMDAGISPSAKIQLETSNEQLFQSGLAAMYPHVGPKVVPFEKALGSKLDVAELPAGKQKATIVHGVAVAMNGKTKYENEAWKFMKFLTGREASMVMATHGFSAPALVDEDVRKVWMDSLPGINLKALYDSLEFGYLYPISKNTAEWMAVEQEEIVNGFLGKQTIEEAAKKAADYMNKVLAEERQ